jgi:hypothetical protein
MAYCATLYLFLLRLIKRNVNFVIGYLLPKPVTKKKLPSVCLLSNKRLGERENFQNCTTLKALTMSSTEKEEGKKNWQLANRN